jgi:putative transposase
MASDPHWDTAILDSQAPRVGTGEPRASAATRRVEGAPAAATADGPGRIFWVILSRLWKSWRSSLRVVRPETVVGWHRRGFRRYWAWKSRPRSGRPAMGTEIRDLIRRMSRANPLWGAPRVHGELLKLGLTVSQATVSRYMLRSEAAITGVANVFKESRQGSHRVGFLHGAYGDVSSPIRARDADPHRRRLVHFNVTEHPTAEWTARQLLEVCTRRLHGI